MTSGKGRCLCGAVRITAQSVETRHHACHCRMCRRLVGGPYFAASAQGVSFEGGENITVYQSSEWAERGFCKVCGSNLFYHLKEPDLYSIAVGIFNKPTQFVLSGEYFIDNKPDGYDFTGDHPRQTEAEIMAEFTSSE